MSFVIGTTFEINGYIGWNKATRDRSIKLSVHDLSTTHTYLSTYEFQCGSSRSTLNLRPDVELVPLNYRIYDFLHAKKMASMRRSPLPIRRNSKFLKFLFRKKKKNDPNRIQSFRSFPFRSITGRILSRTGRKSGEKILFPRESKIPLSSKRAAHALFDLSSLIQRRQLSRDGFVLTRFLVREGRRGRGRAVRSGSTREPIPTGISGKTAGIRGGGAQLALEQA